MTRSAQHAHAAAIYNTVKQLLLPIAQLIFVAYLGSIIAGEGPLDDYVQRRANAKAPPAINKDILVVLIDDEAIAAAPSLLARGGIACLVHLIADQQPSVIALDYIFDKSEEYDRDMPTGCVAQHGALDAGNIPLVVGSELSWPRGYLKEKLPSTDFVPLNALYGFVEVESSRLDNVVRSVRPLIRAAQQPDEPITSFALTAWSAMLMQHERPNVQLTQSTLRRAISKCDTTSRKTSDQLCDYIIRAREYETIRFSEPELLFTIISAADIIHGGCDNNSPPSCRSHRSIRNKIVLIGDANSATTDTHETPLISDYLQYKVALTPRRTRLEHLAF